MRYLTKYWYNKMQKGVMNLTKEENVIIIYLKKVQTLSKTHYKKVHIFLETRYKKVYNIFRGESYV